jgi:hypothetical protein
MALKLVQVHKEKKRGKAAASWRSVQRRLRAHHPDQEDARWPAPALTRTQKTKARTMLQEQAELLGGLSQDTAEKMAQWRTLQRLVRDETVTAADIAWSWVAERIQKGDPKAVGISRPSAGPERKTNRYWKESSQTRSGWKARDRHKFSPPQLEALVETATLEDILVTLDLQDRPGEAPYLSGQQRRDMWQKVKTRAFFKGPGGMRKFNISLGLLMVRGDLQGPVADPKEGGWWEEVMQVSSAIGWTAAPTQGIQTKGQGNPPKQEKSTDPHQGRTRDKGSHQDPTQIQHLTQAIELLEKELEKERLMQLIEEDTGEPWYPRQGSLPNSMWNAMEGSVGPKDPREIHYCAYGHKYKKPTHIWTNLFAWEPSGETLTGTCTKKARCGQGAINPETRKYKHHKSLGQASEQEVSGPGRAAYKASVPRNLHRELLRVLLRTLYDKGWGKGKNTRHTQ